jgi:hypothetical protein
VKFIAILALEPGASTPLTGDQDEAATAGSRRPALLLRVQRLEGDGGAAASHATWRPTPFFGR